MMTQHPYKGFKDRAFWSRAVAGNFNAEELLPTPRRPLISSGDRLVSAGSCFAANIIPYLEKSGFNYLRTERRHSSFLELPKDNFSYDLFSAAYGNIYTARHLLQLLQRCRNTFLPLEDRWHTEEGIVDPFRPGMRYRASFDREFESLTRQHLDRTLKALSDCTVFIFTFGLTEGWEAAVDGAIYPSCPGTVAGQFNSATHRFVNFTADEVADDFMKFAALLRTLNPQVRFILTVSPVPLVATASEMHVMMASSLSKAKLLVAAHRCAKEIPLTTYFPAYEIVTTGGHFEADRRAVTQEGIDTVMNALLANCQCETAFKPEATGTAQQLSRSLADVECEEVAAGL